MSDTDSFIEEVSEEVRRDKLFKFFKKYSWVFIGIVILIVGGAAASEYMKAKTLSNSQAFGEALLDAQEANDAGAFTSLAVGDNPAKILAQLDLAAVLAFEGQTADAATILDAIASDGETLPLYRELALLKSVMINGENMTAADLDNALASLTSEGGPFRLLALEQRAIVSLRNGDTEAALADLKLILDDADSTQDLRNRAQELTISLGGELSAPVSEG